MSGRSGPVEPTRENWHSLPASQQDPLPSPAPTASAPSAAAPTETPVSEYPSTTVVAAAPTSAQAGLTAAAPDIRFNFEPNEHNQYDRVTYKFKLSMVNDSDAADPAVGDKLRNNSIRKIIVAESGVTTGFNITDVEIQDVVSANFRSRGNMTTEIRFTLVEPYSLTLPDKMYAASVELGVPNWRLAPLFLELEFKYIKSDGSFYTPTQGNLVKIYQLLITEFDSQVTEVGSTYQIQAVVQGNRGFTDTFYILPQTHRVTTGQSVSVAAANTVKEFFDNLSTTITEIYTASRRENTNRNVTPIMIYKFVVTPDLGRQEINFSPQSMSRRASFSQATSGGEIIVSRGISIASLVDDILASLKTPEFFIPRPGADGAVRIPRIECRTRNIGWDGLLNDYIREFTFVISMKESVRPVPFREYGEAHQSNPDLQKARLTWLAEYMKKSYDYYYTGLNTEVLNVDIKFNQLHTIVQPLMNTVPLPQYSNAIRVEGFTQEFNEALAARDRLLSERNTAIQAVTPGDESGAVQLSPALAGTQPSLDAENRRLRALSQQSVILFDPSSTVRTDIGLPAESSANETAFRNRIAQINENNRRSAGRKQFLEDTPKRDPATLAADSLRLSYMTDPRDMANTQARAAGGGSQTPEGANNPQDSTRAMVTSILTQIYDRSYQMIEVDMKIKGDPYWLGVSDVERMQELTKFLDGGASTEEVAPSRTNTAEWFNRDAVFLLKFRAGTPPNVATGFQELNNDSDFFYGIYTAIEIKHEFKSGMFTQEVKAIRDMLINVSTIRQAESRVRNVTQPSVASSTSTSATPSQSSPESSEPASRSIQNNNGDPNTPGVTWIAGSSPSGDAARQYLTNSPFQTREGGIAAADARIASITSEGGLRDPSAVSSTRSISLPSSNPNISSSDMARQSLTNSPFQTREGGIAAADARIAEIRRNTN